MEVVGVEVVVVALVVLIRNVTSVVNLVILLANVGCVVVLEDVVVVVHHDFAGAQVTGEGEIAVPFILYPVCTCADLFYHEV